MAGQSSVDRIERLYRDHSSRVLAFALRRGCTMDEAEEVVSECFIAACRRDKEIRGSEELAWLFSTANLVLKNLLRSRRRDETLAAKISLLDPPAELSSNENRFEETQAVREGFAQLNDWDREALLLAFWDGLDHKQAAAVLGVPRPIFSMRLHRAKKRLAKKISPET